MDPPVDSDVVDLNAPFGEQFFDVAVGETKAEVPADRDHDDIGWEAEAAEGGAWDRSRGGRRILMSAVSLLKAVVANATASLTDYSHSSTFVSPTVGPSQVAGKGDRLA